MKILVTGGSGFIGSHLVEALLQEGCDPIIFDEASPHFTPAVPFIRGSVTNRALVRTAADGVDAIFHLAAVLGTHETIERAHATAEVNVLGTLNILDAARELDASVLYVTKPNYWSNPYTVTKVAGEGFASMYRDEFNLNVRVVRCYNVYGPRQRTDIYQKAIPTFVTRALRGEPLPVYGDGTQGTDHIFVSDAVAAMIAVFGSRTTCREVVDIGSGREITVNQIVESVLRFTRSASSIEYIPMRRGEQPQTGIQANTDRLRDLGFVPQVEFEEGLRRTIDFYRSLGT
jgi:UDP-glucose 4-epimerase